MLNNINKTLQDVTPVSNVLLGIPLIAPSLAFTRRKTLDISKTWIKAYKSLLYIYLFSCKLNVLNVLYRERLLFSGCSARRYSKSLTSCNVLNVL